MGLLKNFIKYLVINIIISAILAAVISAAAIYFIPASANRPQPQEKQELIRSKVLLIQEQTELRSAIEQAERGGLLPDWYYQQQLTLLRSKLGVISGQITATQAAIKSLEMLPDQGWQKRFRQVILNNFYYALAVVFLLPVLWKIFLYYIIGYLVEKIPPVRNTSAAREPISAINSFHADVAVDYTIRDGERLFLRSGDWGKKRTNLKARTKLLWQKKYPLISLAADLVELVELSSCDHAPGVVTITSPRSDFFIGRIDISGNCGIVLRPRYLVGVSDGIQVRTRWNFNLHNLISGRIRQVILYGSGTVFIIGAWGIDCTRADCRYDSKIEDNLILGYETSAEYSLCRTETFWHYLRNSTTLLDLQLRQGAFLTQNNACIYTAKDESMFERAVKTLLSGIGSLLGL